MQAKEMKAEKTVELVRKLKQDVNFVVIGDVGFVYIHSLQFMAVL